MQLLEILGAFLHRHPPRDLGHRREQRQLAIRQLHGLVRDANGAAIEMRLRQHLIGGEVEVREEHLPRLHARPLDLDRLLHLEDHVCVGPRRIGRRRNLTACLYVELIRKAAPLTRTLLDQYRVPIGYERLASRGDECDAILIRLDLFRDTDTHGKTPDGKVVTRSRAIVTVLVTVLTTVWGPDSER